MMFNCDGCWDNPCTCGRAYRHMDSHERSALARIITAPELPRGSLGEVTNTNPVVIKGLAELAQDMPDDSLYELRIRFRKTPDGAEVFPQREIVRILLGPVSDPKAENT